ncbi:hypothetical protein [Arthrobacter sp. A2-55]|uniref:hypothetical protein n=1 Tax=Arthrobacter sp. A2-55 TaxID=2897337 RepID=UPI0021CDAE61|nr:hypothetical protein [Arthrobacter sp. A2-55]MCU6480164.1 hypothetical protein [Arthrobacter sp. A2-55]
MGLNVITKYFEDGSIVVERLPADVAKTAAIRLAPGFRPGRVSLPGTRPVRAFHDAVTTPTTMTTLAIPQTDLVELIDELPRFALVFGRGKATIVSHDWSQVTELPAVFVAGVGLKCFSVDALSWGFIEEVAGLAA